jgi:hypothetical protein
MQAPIGIPTGARNGIVVVEYDTVCLHELRMGTKATR